MKDKTALTARQKRFVEEYLACGDGPEAAIAAGYSPATAEERYNAVPFLQQALHFENTLLPYHIILFFS